MKKVKRTLPLLLMSLVALLCLALGACGGKTVRLSFETNGAPAVETMTVDTGSTYTLPDPVWEGHSFEGWFTDKDFTGAPVKTGTAEKDMTFYAKWETLARITLELGGGTLEGGVSTLYLKAGENLYTFMASYVPTKADVQFGAWFTGETELGANTLMPAEGITLTARYKTAYTVQVYLQTLEQDGYTQGEDVIGYEYAGKTLTPAPELHGFTIVDNENSLATKVIAEDAASNIFRLYYDRETYNIFFYPSYPDGTDADAVSRTYLYGTQIDLPADLFAMRGYLIKGWTTDTSEGKLYPIDYTAISFNSDGRAEQQKYTVENNVIFRAVWQKGLTDLFGGTDRIYLFDAESRDIYLERAGILFHGEYRSDSGSFYFDDDTLTDPLEGKLNTDGKTFMFYSAERSVYSRSLYVLGQGVDHSTMIYFDAYNGITYSVEKNTGSGKETDDSEGTYSFDEDGLLIATFTTGTLAGKTLTLMVDEVSIDGSDTPIFMVRNDEEYELGTIYRLAIGESELTYYTNAYKLTLDGFGVATLTSGTSSSAFAYLHEGDELTLLNVSSSGSVSLYAIYHLHPSKVSGQNCYAVYDAETDHTYTAKSGATLELDGCVTAVIRDGNNVTTGYYTAEPSVFGQVVSVVAGKETYVYLTTETERSDVGENGETVTVTEYSYEQKPAKYSAYYYRDSDGTYYAPLVVFDDSMETAGKVTVYGYITATRTYEKVLLGSVQFDDKTDKYLFTKETLYPYPAEVDVSLFDYTKLLTFTFGTDTYISSSMYGTAYLPVTYWYSYTTAEGAVNCDKQYNEQGGSGTLTLIGAFAVLKSGNTLAAGQYSLQNGILSFTPFGESTAYHLELDEENQTFCWLKDYLGTAYGLNVTDGSRNADETLVFNGKGGVTYTKGEEIAEGTYQATQTRTPSGAQVYAFTASDKTLTFEFILLSGSSYTIFSRYDATYAGEYTSADGETLTLDGFGYYAVFRQGADTLAGNYCIPEENVVLFILNGQYAIYFDLQSAQEKTFSIRGGEYGVCVVVDNSGVTELYLDLDGYGKAVVFTYEEDENEESGFKRNVIDGEATYTRTENGFTVTYKNGAKTEELKGTRGTITFSGTTLPAFFIEHREVVYTYVNLSDWSVLVLDAYGTAVKYNPDGSVEEGMYSLFTEQLLYYAKDDGTDDCIFRYDRAAGTVTEIRYIARGYYTADLQALLFSDAGFMIAGGDTLYYYDVDASGNVTLYHQNAADSKANKYGFVQESFGKFENTVTFGGETYYANSGFAINFKREESNAAKFPIQNGRNENNEPIMDNLEQLSFSPTGSSEFTVRGVILISGKSAPCYVTRELMEDGTAILYAMIPLTDGGVYRLDISVKYEGNVSANSQNTYSISALRKENGFYASSYLMYYYLYMMMFGRTITNSFGYITLITEYDDAGTATVSYLNAEFGESSGVFDASGKPLVLEKQQYTLLDTDYYMVELTLGEVLYRLRINLSNSYYSMFGVYSYDIVAFSRVDTLETDGYKVEIERVAVSDFYEAGQTISVILSQGDEEIEGTSVYLYKGRVYYINRTVNEEGVSTATKYYFIDLATKQEVGEEDPLPEYQGATVTVCDVKTYYVADSKEYVDVDETAQKVYLFIYNRTIYLAEDTVYADGVYTVTTPGGASYTVKIENGTASVAPAETAETPEDETEA